MKIKLNKKYIEDYQLERVKADAKDFAAANTLNDLVRVFEAQTDEFIGNRPEVIKAEIEAMDSGWACGNKTIFEVHMVIDDFDSMFKVMFWIDMELNVDTRTLADGIKMYNIKRYEIA